MLVVMKFRSPLPPRFFPVLAIIAVAASLQAGGEDDPMSRLRAAERELERVRGHLHEAHLELAARGERIEALERMLVAAKGEGEKQPQPSPVEPAPVEPAPTPSPDSFTIAYEPNSAANLEGREQALAWVREQLRRDPGIGFEITGAANDSRHAEVNRLVASNRARYLADFFVSRGLPREAIISAEGTPSETEGAEGRSVKIAAVARKGGDEGRGEAAGR